MKPNYQYPLELDWTTDEMIKVTTFYQLVEDAYEHGVDRDNLLAAYRGFKTVVPDQATEKTLGREFETVSGYSLYTVVKAARSGSQKKIKVRLS
ncbi:UPF0223 family protein [Lacticaseibacillus baoqingensis]|uniref:UPF0223 protein ACFQ5J_03440 n=1 Tax=Lacticaseibacillus baoqingensis TaxID=2486013 RepID=A0ABW4E2Z3_9LACO|nr:UPF0223 family protein [Lacticaseibacillus baoqingensis]